MNLSQLLLYRTVDINATHSTPQRWMKITDLKTQEMDKKTPKICTAYLWFVVRSPEKYNSTGNSMKLATLTPVHISAPCYKQNWTHNSSINHSPFRVSRGTINRKVGTMLLPTVHAVRYMEVMNTSVFQLIPLGLCTKPPLTLHCPSRCTKAFHLMDAAAYNNRLPKLISISIFTWRWENKVTHSPM